MTAVRMTGVRVNHDRVTVPPESGLSFVATAQPTGVSNVTWSLTGTGGTVINPGTTISGAGVITVAVTQTGGAARADASQTITHPDGSTETTTGGAPFNFSAIPGAISATTGSTRGVRGSYGGDFTQTFSPPAGSTAAALHRAHVNEQFAGTTGTTLSLSGTIGSIDITVNDPASASAGWDLTSSGTMAGPDHVSWTHAGFDARPFVVNASNPTPSNRLPQAITTTQSFHNLSFPSRTYGTSAVATTTHRRAFEDRSAVLKAVTSALPPGATTPEVEEDYKGPAVFRRCVADPSTVSPSAAAPARGRAPAPNTSTVSVDREGAAATPTFSIQGPALGCTVNARTGVVRIGTTPGSIRVRAGVAANFDETTITIAAPTPPTPSPTPTP